MRDRMSDRSMFISSARIIFALALIVSLTGCAQTYYGAMEKLGIPKRDILVDRVEGARDSQSEAQEQFKSALDQFASVVQLPQTDLKTTYETLNSEYEQSRDAAADVSDRIEKVESVAKALFSEWEDELALYKNQDLRRSAEQKMRLTRQRYDGLMASMRRAEDSMQPVLDSLRDNVLYLKHNLNAQAIGALKSEFAGLEGEISRLIDNMNRSINESNRFIAELNSDA